MKLYAKRNVINTVSAMKKTGRFAHGFLITGEKGSGRTTAAKFIAQSLACLSPDENGLPCGECRSCRLIEKDIYADVTFPQGEGKSGEYRVKKMREVLVPDIFVFPNDGDIKVYIFKDAGKLLNEQCQNALLKVIEEPPDHAYFIFTAADKKALLSTVLSRIVTLEIPECSRAECESALRDMGKYSDEDIAEAVSAYGGNIGKCVDFIERGEMYKLYETVKNIYGGIISRNKYIILKELSDCTERAKFAEILGMTDRVIRDALVMRSSGEGAELTGCSAEIAKELSGRIGSARALNIHEKLIEAQEWCGASMNMNLTAASCIITDILSGI